MVFGRERRQPDDRGTAAAASRRGDGGGDGGDGDRPGRRGRLAGTLRLPGVQQFVSVRVVAAVQPRDRGHRKQDERRERQVDDGYPEQRRVRAVENKTHTMYPPRSARLGEGGPNDGLGRTRVENEYTREVRVQSRAKEKLSEKKSVEYRGRVGVGGGWNACFGAPGHGFGKASEIILEIY